MRAQPVPSALRELFPVSMEIDASAFA